MDKGRELGKSARAGLTPNVVSLGGPEGDQVVQNLAFLALGQVTPEELGTAYFVDGHAVGAYVDSDTFDKLASLDSTK